MVNHKCGFNQSEMGKNFERIIITFTYNDLTMILPHKFGLVNQGSNDTCL